MDSDYELVDSDGDFVDQGASSDESLVALSGDSEDDLVQNSRILARKKGSHILSPHQTSTRNTKKRPHYEEGIGPQPSGWLTTTRGPSEPHTEDLMHLPSKRPKLSDLSQEHQRLQMRVAAGMASSTSSNMVPHIPHNGVQNGNYYAIPSMVPLVPIMPHMPYIQHPAVYMPPVYSAPSVSSYDDEPVLVISDDEAPVAAPSLEPRGRLRQGGATNGNRRVAATKPPPKASYEEATLDDIDSDRSFEEEVGDESEEYEAASVRFERVVNAAMKISTKVRTNLETNSVMPPGAKSTDLLYAKPIKALIPQPESVPKKLKDYQVVGLNWLRILHLSSVNGMLADEMGLGKTIQTISFLCWLKESRQMYLLKGGEGVKPKGVSGAIADPSRDYFSFSEVHCDWPTLIVAPASTLANWKRELETWAPSLRVLLFHGTRTQRDDMKEDIKLYWKRYKEHSFDVIISTYQLVSSKTDGIFFKHGIRFHYLVVDEAQMLKGKKTARFAHLSQVRAVRRLMLTGTPLQNNLDELQALVGFLMPSLFGKLMELSLKKELQAHREQGKGVHESEYINNLKLLLNPFILRRLKSQVGLGLLPKIHSIIEVVPSEVQAKLNAALFARCKSALQTNPTTQTTVQAPIDLTTEDSNGSKAEVQKQEIEQSPTDPNFMLANLLMQLRKSANHPIFIRAFYSPEQVVEIANVLFARKHKKFKGYTFDEILNDLTLSSDWTLHNICLEYPASLKHLVLTDEQLFDSSGKFVELSKLLPRLKAEGHRVVLFSQFTTVLDVLEQFLSRRMHYGYQRLDGSTAVAERQVRMDSFNVNANDEYFVFLASTLAGGLGVNLTSADTVIFFDMSFNPHVDRQAEDRCHRLGQEKQVTIYNLIMPGTIEEHMHRMAAAKTELNDVMLNEGSFADKEALESMGGEDGETPNETEPQIDDSDSSCSETKTKAKGKGKAAAKSQAKNLSSSQQDEDEAHPAYHIRKTSAELMFMQQVAKSIAQQ